MKEPVRKKIKQVILTLRISGRKVIDVFEEITKANVNNYSDLMLELNNYSINVYTFREETEAEFSERVDKYTKFLDNKKKKERKKIEKDLEKKISEMEKLQKQIERMKENQPEINSFKESIKAKVDFIKEEKRIKKEKEKLEKERIKQEKINEKISSIPNSRARLGKI